jgi:hypothetical protein
MDLPASSLPIVLPVAEIHGIALTAIAPLIKDMEKFLTNGHRLSEPREFLRRDGLV